MKNNIFNDDDDLSNGFDSDKYFNDNTNNSFNSFNSYFDENLSDNLDSSNSLSSNFDEPKQNIHNPYSISFDFEKSLKLTGKASAVDEVEVGSVQFEADKVKVDKAAGIDAVDGVEVGKVKIDEVDKVNLHKAAVDEANKTNLAGPANMTVFGNTKMTVLPTTENNVAFEEAAQANNLTHKQPNLLTKQKDECIGTTTELDTEKASLTSQASSVTIAEEKANQLEAKLKAKLNKLSDRKRKLLGYSMITIGVVLSSILIVTTFASLEFKDVFLKSTSASKDTLTKILAKTGTAESKSNFDSNSNFNSNKATTKSEPDPDNNNAVDGNNAANNNSNSNVIINLSDSDSHSSNAKNKGVGSGDNEANEVSNEVLADWQPITSLLASTPNRRKLAAKTLGIDKGEWVLACFSVGCGDCDRAAIKLNQLKANGNVGNVLAITTASLSEANLWKERLGLGFEVRSVSSQTFDDTGTVFLPTIIKLKNGVSIGAKESLGSN